MWPGQPNSAVVAAADIAAAGIAAAVGWQLLEAGLPHQIPCLP